MRWATRYRRAARQSQMVDDLFLTLRAAFDETKIVRNEDGEFAEKGGGGRGGDIAKEYERYIEKAWEMTLTQEDLDTFGDSLAKLSTKELNGLLEKTGWTGKETKKKAIEIFRRRLESKMETALNTKFAKNR